MVRLFFGAIRTIACYDAVALEADVSEELVVVSLAVGQALLLVMPMAKERLLTLGTHKMLKHKIQVQDEFRYNNNNNDDNDYNNNNNNNKIDASGVKRLIPCMSFCS